MSEPTTIFSIYDDKDREIRAVLTEVYRALKEKGYNPINQLVGYILSCLLLLVMWWTMLSW